MKIKKKKTGMKIADPSYDGIWVNNKGTMLLIVLYHLFGSWVGMVLNWVPLKGAEIETK